jgi:ABC-type nickel/cobalt efflux system permease component RcnA
MELGLFLIFWYGVMHALGPDHLAAIADFSIGKQKRKALLITLLFALGHGITLFAFAKLLQQFPPISAFTDYGDLISASVILLMGGYLLFMALTERITLRPHQHGGQSHIHIGFSNSHRHETGDWFPALGLGVLMGIGGVRGMLITLGLLDQQAITLSVVGVFALGVMGVFLLFGVVMLYVNRYLLNTPASVKRIFTLLGLSSMAIGGGMLWA